MIPVHVHGHRGRMGAAAVAAIDAADDLRLVGATGRGDDLGGALRETQPDVVVEFTRPDVVEHSLRVCIEHRVHAVSGTTGLPVETARELGALAAARELGVLLAPNFAIGVLLMQRFAREAARWFDDVELIELHHEKKLDAPSGTALDTARQIVASAGRPLNAGRHDSETLPGVRGGRVDDVPVHSVRLPGLLAHQEVLFGSPGQVLTLRHDTLDRAAFMPGLLLGVRKVRSYRGLVDSLEPLLDR